MLQHTDSGHLEADSRFKCSSFKANKSVKRTEKAPEPVKSRLSQLGGQELSAYHDAFNLIALLPIIILNILNWDWKLVMECILRKTSSLTLKMACRGSDASTLLYTVGIYFVIDTIWILLFPETVNSPQTIVHHHIICILWVCITFTQPQYQWFMMACLFVEINTWFLIARRMLHKAQNRSFKFRIVKMEVKIVSVFFYVTWVLFRIIMYPYLFSGIYELWLEITKETKTPYNVTLLILVGHTIFTALNFKWSVDLIMSKLRRTKPREDKKEKGL